MEPTNLRLVPGLVPPHDMDAEAAVLSTILLRGDDCDMVLPIMRPEHCYSDSNRNIMAAIIALREANQPCDVLTVAHWMRAADTLLKSGGSPYLSQIIDCTPCIVNVAAHAEIVRDLWQKRQLIATCQRYVAEGYTLSVTGHELVQQCENAIGDLAATSTGQHFQRLGQIMDDEVARLLLAKQSGTVLTGLTTGLKRLDDLSAGLHKSDLTIIAARPGVGKTSFACNIMAAAVKPTRSGGPPPGVGFFSLEMPKAQIAVRFACAEGNVNAAAVRMNRLHPDDWTAFIAGSHVYDQAPIWIDDTPALPLLDLRARARKLKRDLDNGRSDVPCSGLGLIVVDYLQLVKGDRPHGASREQEVASVSKGLKQLAKDLDVPVLALAQLNRNVDKGKKKDRQPELSDLRESGQIEQDADNIWFLYRPELHDTEATKGTAQLIIAKARNGPCDTVELFFRGESMRFSESVGDSYSQFDDEFDPGI